MRQGEEHLPRSVSPCLLFAPTSRTGLHLTLRPQALACNAARTLLVVLRGEVERESDLVCGQLPPAAGKEARELEAALGVPVLRHREKKPGGGSGELEAHFGCPAADLIMVGDRWGAGGKGGSLVHGETVMAVVRPAVDST